MISLTSSGVRSLLWKNYKSDYLVLTYFYGELTVDFPEDVRIPIEPNQMATAAVSGNRIKFEYCGLSRAIALLKEQYAVGTVEVRIVRPRPLKISSTSRRSKEKWQFM